MKQQEKIVSRADAESIVKNARAVRVADDLYQTPAVTIRLSTLPGGRVKMTLTERNCAC